MNTQSIRTAWKESFSWLTKQELKTLTLVTLNTFLRSIKLMIKHFSWLFALWAGAFIIYLYHPASTIQSLSFGMIMGIADINPALFTNASIGILCILGALDYIFIYGAYLTVRPSLEAKNMDYYKKYIPKVFNFLMIQIIVNYIIELSKMVIFMLFNKHIIVEYSMNIIWWGLPIIAGLYTLDMDVIGFKKLIYKIFSIFIHFFPVLLCASIINIFIGSIFWAICWGIIALCHHAIVTNLVLFIFFFISSFILGLFMYAVYATLYVKIKHSNPSIFLCDNL